MGFSTSLPHDDENEEEMLRRAIAMSLEEQEEELPFGTGLILKDDIAKSKSVLITLNLPPCIYATISIIKKIAT